MTPPTPTIVVALIQRGSRLLLVEAQGPDDPTPVWMLPGGQVEDNEGLLAALRRELAEETGLQIVGEPQLVFEVLVDYRTDIATGPYRALTYLFEATGQLQPDDPDGLVRSAAWVEINEALDRLSQLEWYECEPLSRFLSGETAAGAAYRYRVGGKRGSMMRDGLELVDRGDRVLDALVAWGERTPEIRAMVLTSNRARPDGPVDEFSDYDVILAVTDPERFAGDLAWQEEAYGPRLVSWGDEDELFGMPTRFRGVMHRDHVKVDYTIWPDALLEAVAAHRTLPEGLDRGYRVLLDKDGRVRGWPEPTFTAYVLAPPSEAAYRAQVEEFWWDVSYLPKSVRRGDLFFASSFMLEHDLKYLSLRRMLEWRIAVQRDWIFAPGSHGRHLEQHLDAETLHDLSETYASLDADAIWDAVFRLAALYRRVATEVATALGYEYPQEIDDRMTAYLRGVRKQGR